MHLFMVVLTNDTHVGLLENIYSIYLISRINIYLYLFPYNYFFGIFIIYHQKDLYNNCVNKDEIDILILVVGGPPPS
jgi:hypothetical protein